MYELYLGSSTAGFAPHILLREIGAHFTLRLLDIDAGEHKRPEYLQINPLGRVPALVADGRVVVESAAICLWLADRHADAQLAPRNDDLDRAKYLQWMLFLASTVHGALMPYFYPQRYTSDANIEAVKQAAMTAASAWFETADRHLAEHGPYLLGARITAADFYLFMLVRWGRHFEVRPSRSPALGAFMRRVFERPAVRAAFAAEGITENFF